MNKQVWISIILLAFTIGLYGQSSKVLIKAGDDLMLDKKWHDAIERYEKAAEDEDEQDNLALAANLALANINVRDYKAAEKWALKATKLDVERTKLFPLSKFYLAQAQHSQGKYKSAKESYKAFSKEFRGGLEAQYWKSIAKSAVASCDYALKNLNDTTMNVEVYHLRKGINSHYTEFAPVVVGSSTLLYSSVKSYKELKEDPKVKGEKVYAKIYKTKMVGENQWSDGVELNGPYNVEGMHTGDGAYSPDRRRFYFTRCKESFEKKTMTCAIYVSERSEEGWSKAVKLGSEVNSPGTSNNSPTVSTSKKGDEVLYFVSDRPFRSKDVGKDIWYTVIDNTGKFKAAKNCGTKINTTGDDISPWFNAKENRMYFASNGQKSGYGGFDVFYTTGKEGRWKPSKNLGKPINTSYDEMYYSLKNDGKGGFFVSNRPGILGLWSETCCDDIFSFDIIQPVYAAVTGQIREKIDSFGTPFELVSTDAIVALSLIDAETGDENIIAYDTLSVKKDSFYFDLNLNQDYKITASKEGFLSGSGAFSTHKFEVSDTLNSTATISKSLEPQTFVLENVYYEFAKDFLKPTSFKSLDSLVSFLNENNTLKVELGAHTDSKGSDEYNQELSERRAKSVVRYLTEKGVDPIRMIAVGYGEKQPIAANENPDGSDNEEGRALNRRTEMKILGTVKGVNIGYKQRFRAIDDEKKAQGGVDVSPEEAKKARLEEAAKKAKEAKEAEDMNLENAKKELEDKGKKKKKKKKKKE